MEVTYTKWMCDYCAEEFESRPDCIKHKMHCGYNPEMRRCLTCGNAKVDKIRTGSKTTAFRFACTNNKLQNEATNTMGLQRACSYWKPKAEPLFGTPDNHRG